MKGKVNLKTIIILGISVLVIVLLVLGVKVVKTVISGAAAGYEPQSLTATPKEDGKSAVVSWTTDKSVKASIFYGTNMASLLLMAEDVEPTSNHNILLTNLRSDTTYFYKIVVDNNNIFDNGGSMFSFKTVAAVVEQPVEEVSSLEQTMDIKPTITQAPVASSSTSSAKTNCDKKTDYNKDGVVNSIDYISCMRGKITPAATTTGTVDKCAGDYNKDGIVNSLDRIRCLQDSKN